MCAQLFKICTIAVFWQLTTAFAAALFLAPVGVAAQSNAALLIGAIMDEIVMPIVWFLLAIAVMVLVYGIFMALTQSSDEMKKRGKTISTWGLAGLLVMVSVLGIMSMLVDFTGAGDTFEINQGGNIQITVPDVPDFGS